MLLGSVMAVMHDKLCKEGIPTPGVGGEDEGFYSGFAN